MSGPDENLYKPPVVQPPTKEDMVELNEQLRLNCSVEDLEVYREKICGVLDAYKIIDTMATPILPVKYPRTPGHRPTAEDNPFNAWYWKCDIAGADDGKLKGKTVAIKDNIAVAGVPMMNGSKILEGYTPEFDATVVTRILDAGGRILGKSACEDLCFSGCSFTNSKHPVLNPASAGHTTGGSSAGSGALVASGIVDMAIGGDQGGSVRIPACWCGIVGLKPTWGLIPYTGAVPIETSIDHLGPMTKTVYDCALMLEVLAGYDGGLDARQHPGIVVPEYTKQLLTDLTGKRIGLLTEGFDFSEPETAAIVREAALSLKNVGATVEDVSIPLHKVAKGIWNPIIMEGAYEIMVRGNDEDWFVKLVTAPTVVWFALVADSEKSGVEFDVTDGQASRNLFNLMATSLPANWLLNKNNSTWTRGPGYGFGDKGFYSSSLQNALSRGFAARPWDMSETVKFIALHAEHARRRSHNRFYGIGQSLNLKLVEAYNATLASYDVIIMPTLPSPAPKLPLKSSTMSERVDSALGMVDNTAPFDASGHPALSINAGFIQNLPVGMMIVGRHFDETSVLQVAHAYEKLRG